MDDSKALVALIVVLLMVCMMKSIHISYTEGFRGKVVELVVETYFPWDAEK